MSMYTRENTKVVAFMMKSFRAYKFLHEFTLHEKYEMQSCHLHYPLTRLDLVLKFLFPDTWIISIEEIRGWGESNDKVCSAASKNYSRCFHEFAVFLKFFIVFVFQKQFLHHENSTN